MNYSFAGLLGKDSEVRIQSLILFGYQGGDVALEKTDADAKDDQADDKNTQGGARVFENTWNRRDDDDDMADDGDADGNVDRLKAAPVGIGEISTGHGRDKRPEGVEQDQTQGGLRAIA